MLIASTSNTTAFVYTGARPLVRAQPSIMFIHGAANDHSVWALQSRYFAHHGWNVVAVDLPGHGKTSGAPLHSIEDMADWCAQVLRDAGIAQAAIVGHSMGSLIALEVAVRHPELVTRIALVGTAFPMKVADSLLGSARAGEHAALDMINVWGHSNAGQLGGHRAPGQWMMGAGMRLMERNATSLYTDFKACNEYGGGNANASRVACPVLVIAGTRDLMTPAKSARSLSGQFTHAQVVMLPGAGHDIMAEQPDQLLDALIAFLG